MQSLENAIDRIAFSLERKLPDCTFRYEADNTVRFQKNDNEWFCIKFSALPYGIPGLVMDVSGPKPKKMDMEAMVGYFGGDKLLFRCMQEEKYVLRVARKYFIECGYETEDDE